MSRRRTPAPRRAPRPATRVVPRRPPRLTGDAFRAWFALGLTVPVAAAVGLAASPDLGEDGRAAFVRGQLVVGLASLVAYFVLYAVLTWSTFRSSERPELERVLRATRPRERSARVALALSGGGATSWSVSAGLFSLAVVVLVAVQPVLRADAMVLVASGLAVIASWLVVVVTFAVQYMRTDVESGGLAFPGEERPVFDDYAYLALQISTTYSSSDVEVTTRAMRRRVGRHTLVAFVFNSVIVALLVSALLAGVSG